MRYFPQSAKWRTILLTLWALVATMGTVWYFHGLEIKWYVARQVSIYRLRDSEHPVTRMIARGELQRGTGLEEVIAAHPPERVRHYGGITVATYADGLVLTALRGKVVQAVHGWCSRALVFFACTPLERAEYDAHYSRWWRSPLQARAAVLGVAATGFIRDGLADSPSFPEGTAGDSP